MAKNKNALLFYVQLKGYGMGTAKKREVVGVGMSGARIFAEADKPLCLIVAMLEEMQFCWKYSTTEAAKADLQRLKDYVDSIEIEDEQSDST